MSKPVPGVYGDWICMSLGEQWRAYCDLEQRLAAAEAELEKCRFLQQDMNTIYTVSNLTKERDEARAAARFCWTCGCQNMWETYRSEAMKKWPWLEEAKKEATSDGT